MHQGLRAERLASGCYYTQLTKFIQQCAVVPMWSWRIYLHARRNAGRYPGRGISIFGCCGPGTRAGGGGPPQLGEGHYHVLLAHVLHGAREGDMVPDPVQRE